MAQARTPASGSRTFTFSPMYDTKKVRLTMSIQGHALVPTSAKNADILHKVQTEAWGGAATDDNYDQEPQRSTLEIPPVPKGTKVNELQRVLSVILRGWRGTKKLGEVPRGPTAKQLLGKK
ncbi:unnamed protein product [Prorocentrum cordatum]|uniref:Uncharacterized protein n=1 Tax=Prorocentrum cordatum TaxID=2364126 RepID=A0ABN9T6A3_9DINO|nr:unnamed protein product [Polarella glacialis]